MPAGIGNPAFGYATFCAIKFAGYAAAAHFLSRRYGREDVSPWQFGTVRTLIGMVAGAVYLLVLWPAIMPALVSKGGMFDSPYTYLAGLLPIRIAEWWLVIWLFYDVEMRQVGKDWRMVGLGTAWSYVLDAPAIAGLFATAGAWIC